MRFRIETGYPPQDLREWRNGRRGSLRSCWAKTHESSNLSSRTNMRRWRNFGRRASLRSSWITSMGVQLPLSAPRLWPSTPIASGTHQNRLFAGATPASATRLWALSSFRRAFPWHGKGGRSVAGRVHQNGYDFLCSKEGVLHKSINPLAWRILWKIYGLYKVDKNVEQRK